MRTTDLFPSRYVKASDLDTGPQQVAIRELAIEEIGQGKQREAKPVLYFHNRQKGLVLNVTNTRTIEDAYGVETDDWTGKTIELFATKVDFKGDRVDGVRVRVPKAPDAKELVEPASPAPAGGGGAVADLNDDIPFVPLRDLP